MWWFNEARTMPGRIAPTSSRAWRSFTLTPSSVRSSCVRSRSRSSSCAKGHDVDDRDRTADCKDRNGCVEPQLALAAFRRAGNGDEGANLKAPLPRLAVRRLIGVGEQCIAAVVEKFLQEFAIPFFVDLSGVGSCRPVRDSARADERDALGRAIARAAQGAAEGPATLERYQRRTLAVDVHGNDRQIVARR